MLRRVMFKKREIEREFGELPARVTEYVRRVVKMMGYRRKVRKDVRAELLSHFVDALRDCPSPGEGIT